MKAEAEQIIFNTLNKYWEFAEGVLAKKIYEAIRSAGMLCESDPDYDGSLRNTMINWWEHNVEMNWDHDYVENGVINKADFLRLVDKLTLKPTER